MTLYLRDGIDQFAGQRAGSQSQRLRSGGRGGSGNADVTNYPGQVLMNLNWTLPVAVSSRRWARVSFWINPDGSLGSVDIIDGFGSSEIDRAAKTQVRRGVPFPKPPQRKGRLLTFVYWTCHALMPLRFRPAHLMTPAELEKAIAELRRRCMSNPKAVNRLDSLKKFLSEKSRRKTETAIDRAKRLRTRIAWETAQDKLEKKKRLGRYADPALRYWKLRPPEIRAKRIFSVKNRSLWPSPF
ncbi:TonB family protein [Lutimaribacter marinistellae]|uniref:TonB family protein n=1 Tax=Lutimaribacter marinistellae TaxID=1820329 RepID=A0ABV7TCI7_9RHOB